MSIVPGIVINRMYAGDYLSSNLGHEIINLFQADNGEHYLYLNSIGNFRKKHLGIDVMLLVKAHNVDTFEVIGMAKGLTPVPGANKKMLREKGVKNTRIFKQQKSYIESQNGGVKYGGVSILDIFSDAEQQNIFLTFKAKNVFKPKHRIFLKYNIKAENSTKDKELTVALHSHNLPRTSLKSYIYPDDISLQQTQQSDYQNIMDNIVENTDIWAISEGKPTPENAETSKRISLFDICKMRDDENRISNALAYFLNDNRYRNMWREFFLNHKIRLDATYSVKREVSTKRKELTNSDNSENKNEPRSKYNTSGRIDILIEDDHNFIVIENKIKSGINRVQSDPDEENQLDRYIRFAETETSDRSETQKTSKNRKYFIFAPNYNVPVLKSKAKACFTIITYGDIYAFLGKKDNMALIEKDANFLALYDTIKWHTFDNPNDYLYYEMMEKFYNRILESKNRQQST